MSNKNEKDPPSSGPSNPFGDIMPWQVCQRNLFALLSLRTKYREPISTDLRNRKGLMDPEDSLRRCLIERAALWLQEVLKEIYRRVDLMERAAVVRYPPYEGDRFRTLLFVELPKWRLSDDWVQICNRFADEIRRQYPKCLQLICVPATMINSADLSDNTNPNPILDPAFLDLTDLRQRFGFDFYCDPADCPPFVTAQRTKYCIRVKPGSGWDTCISNFVKEFSDGTALPKPSSDIVPLRTKANDRKITDHDRDGAERALNDPKKYPSMTAREIAAALNTSIQAVYKHPELELFPTGNRSRRWTTESVLAIRNSLPE